MASCLMVVSSLRCENVVARRVRSASQLFEFKKLCYYQLWVINKIQK